MFASRSFALARTRRGTVGDSDGRREGRVNAAVERDMKEDAMAAWTIQADFLDSDGRVGVGPGARRRASAGVLASVLLGFAALLAAPQTAHAVDKEIFSRTLTVGATSSATSTTFGFDGGVDMVGGDLGNLAQRTIPEFKASGVTDNRWITVLTNDNASGGTLLLKISGAGSMDLFDDAAFRARLTLHLETDSFDGADATESGSTTLTWANSGLTWADMETYSVRMTLDVPGIDSIAFSSSPATGTTYDTGESVTATVTFDEAVDVTGTPQLTINMGGTDKVLDYSSGSGTTALVFSGYTVALGDTDTDGLSIDADELDLNGGTIKATADENPDAVLTHTAVAASSSHKVNGVTVPTGPGVDAIAFNSAGSDGAFKTGDAVTATVTFSASVTVDTTDGTPQLTIDMGGTDEVLNYASGSPGTALVFSGYTVAANDEDTDGLSIAANKLDANSGTIKATADATLNAVLTHAAVAASANHKVDGVKPTLVTTGDDAPKTSTDGRKVILKFSETLRFTNTSDFAVEATGSSVFLSGSTRKADGVVELQIPAYDRIETGASVTVALDVGAVTDSAGNTNAALSATTVVNRVVSPPGKPTLTLAAKDQSIDATVAFTDHGTSDITKYQYRTKTTGSYGAWTDSTENVSNTGGTFTIGGLTNGTQYTVQARGVNSDGDGAASDAKTATPGGTPTVSSITIGTNGPYKIGDAVTVAVVFSEAVTVDTTGGTPQITIDVGGSDKVLSYASGAGNTLLFSGYTVAANDEDTDGISIAANKLDDNDGTIKATAGANLDAVLTHAAVAASANHKVDGVKPTLTTTGVTAPRTSLDGSKIVLDFSEIIGSVDHTKITVKEGTTTLMTSGGSKSGGATVEITLTTALSATATNLTVALDAEAVTDVPGNGIAAVSATTLIRASAPGSPVLTAAAKDESIELSWTIADHGSSNINRFEYRIKETTGGTYPATWTNTRATASNTGGSATIGSLANGTQYTVQVRGVNFDGEGAGSNEPTATPDAPPAVSSVAITSDPGTDKTYIIGEDIVVTVTFDKNITLSGSGTNPVLGVQIGTVGSSLLCQLAAAMTMKLECTDTVANNDEDSDGISIEANGLQFLDRMIIGPLGQSANLDYSALDDDSDHKVDGVKPTLSRADADPNDLTKVILTFSEAIGTVTQADITVKKGTTDQSIDSVAIDSTDATKVVVTLDTALLTTDTNVTVDLDADAVKDVPGNGIAEVLGTSVSIEDTVAPTLISAGTWVIDDTSIGIALQFNETIASTSIPASSAFAAKIAGTAVGVTSVRRDVNNADTVNLVLNANPKAGEAVLVSYTLPGSNPLEDEAGNDVASFTDEAVTNNNSAPGKPTVTVAAKDASLEVTVAFTAHGTHNITKYQYQVKTTGSFGTWTDSTENVSNTGGTFTIGSLTNGTAHTVKVRGVSAAGDGAASDEASATPQAPPAVSEVAITSTPTTANTYIIGDEIEITVTFDKVITLGSGSHSPNMSVTVGSASKQTDTCVIGTDTTTLVCTETVSSGDEDTNGISIGANALFEVDKRILGPLGQRANLEHSQLADDSDHKVDGIRPTLSRADADPNDLTKIILTFSEAIGTVTQADITVEKGMTAQTIDSVAIDSTDATKVVVTLDTALLSTDTNITVDLAADAVKDVPGNGIDVDSGNPVSLVDTTAPTLVSASITSSVPNLLVLTFNENLDITSVADKSAFEVEVEEADRSVSQTSVLTDGNNNPTAIVLTLGSAVRPGETVTVSYAKPSSNPLKDAADNEVESFTDQAVSNNLPATAPEAPGNLEATATHADKVAVTWDTPWDNGSAITRFEYRSVAGNSVPASTAWTAVPDSGPTTTGFALVTLAPGTEYAVEIRAVNGEGNGDEAAATATTPTPTWSLVLFPVISGAEKLTEGGASRTARLFISNDVRFAADQTITLKWGDDEIDSGLIQGANGSATFTIDAGDRQGELEISAPDRPGDLYRPPETKNLTANLGGEQVGPSIALEFVDDEAKPVLTIGMRATLGQTERSTQLRQVEGGTIYIDGHLNRGHDSDVLTSLQAELTGATNKFPANTFVTRNGKTVFLLQFTPGATTSLSTSITLVDGSTAGDSSEHVFTIVPNPDYHTVGTPSSATLTILDNDAAPAAPRNLRAQSRDGSVVLTWDPPTSLATTEFTAYELRHVAGNTPGGTFADISTDPGTATHTVTGLTNETEYTFELRAKNSFGSSSPVSVSKTPRVGVAVSFAEAAASVEEGQSASVTVTLGEAPTASVTVPIADTPGAGLDSNEYSGVPSNVTFNAGQTSRSFTVDTEDNAVDEPDRTLTLSLGTLPDGYVPGANDALVLTIADNDVPRVSASFDVAAASVAEGVEYDVTVRLSQAPEREVALPIDAMRGANLAADEVDGVPESVTFAADATEAEFTVTFVDDALKEGNETLTLTFGTLPFRVNSAGEHPQLVLTVEDDDGPPSVPDVTVQTGDGYAALSWQPVANDSPILRYEVRWKEDGGAFTAWVSAGTDTRYRAEGLANGKAHEFEVRAVNAHGDGESASATRTPTARLTGIPTAPQWLRFADVTDSSRAELKWGSPSNGTDKVTANSATATFAQIQGYRIEVCRTACGGADAEWYAVVANTGEFKHTYVHQVLAPGVIRENRYRVRAININGKAGPWSNTAKLDPTRLERFWLVSPNSSTVDVHLEVWNPDGNPLYVRYTGGGEVRYKQQRLTKKGYPVIGLPVEASTHYKVDVDFVDTFDSDRFQTAKVWSLQTGADPYTSPYAKDLLDAEVWRGGQWREAPDNQLYLRMGGTGKYRVRLKPCTRIYNVRPVRIQAPAGRLRASPTDFEPALFANLNCEVVQDGWRTDENGDYVLMKDVYDMTNFPDRANDRIPVHAGAPNVWREVTVTARALEDYDADVRADALLSAPFAVVYNHEVSYGSDDTRSGLVSEGTGLVRISLDRPEGATLPVPGGVTIGSGRVMSWDAVPGASNYLVVWRYGPRYSDRANTDRSHVSGTSKTLPLGGSGRGPITARVRAYSASAVSDWSDELTWDSRAPTLSVLDTAVNEDDGSVGFLVKLEPAATGTVTVDYTTVDGTAVSPADYAATSGTLTFSPGQREKKTALVPIVDDDEEDSGETFRVVLSNPTGSDANNGAAVLGDAEAVATILNSEEAVAELTGFTLVDAGTNADLMALADGATVRLGELLASSYGIRANLGTGAAPGSVRIELSGAKTAANTDDAAPYSLYGDGAGRINGASLPPGSYALTATAYANSGGQGDELGTLTVSFTVAAGALQVTTPGPFEVAEGTTAVATLAASETGTGATASWSIPEGTAGGADADAFALTAQGVLSLVAAKDFEAPDDADGDGTYEVTVSVTAGAQNATASLSVTLSDVYEVALEVTTPGPFEVAEGATAVATLEASDTGTGESASWSIPAGTAGGADADAFALTAQGVLSLAAAKDFEAPDDADGDGVYEVTVTAAVPAAAAARAQSATAALRVTLTDANEAPVANASASPEQVREGAKVTLDGSASTDPDANDTLSFAWTQVQDGAPRVTLSDAAAAQAAFTSPSDLAEETELGFTLRVTDAAGLTAEDTATVTVTLVSEVSIAPGADYPSEGAEAVFRLTRAGSALKSLTVPVTVEETGAMLGEEIPRNATIAAGSREAELRVPTAADAVSENDSRVTVRLGSGAGWRLAPGAASATVTVLDDDAAPVTGTSAADVTVWAADMTVVEYGPRSIGAGTAEQFSNQQGRAGLRAKWLWYDPVARTLKLGFDDSLDDAEELTLHVGAVSLGFPDNSGGDSSFSLENVDIAWRDGETLAVRVSKPSTESVSTDAALASLSVEGATLSPAFDAAVLVYRAAVDAGVETATVAATASDAGAAVTYGPAADADEALAHHQVAMPDEGETLVEVTSTAADGTVRRYRVVLVRAPQTAASNAAPDGAAGDLGHARGGRGTDGLGGRGRGRGRSGRRDLRLAVAGGRRGDRRRDRNGLRAGSGGRRENAQGAGDVHRRQGHGGVPHQCAHGGGGGGGADGAARA